MADIIRFYIDDADTRRLKNPKERQEATNILTTGAGGQQFAQDFHAVVKDLLSKTHKFRHGYPIGASGASSENIDLRMEVNNAAVKSWVVSEGNRTPVNEIIRKGVPKGTIVPVSRLRQWAFDKGIKFSKKGKPGVRPMLQQKSRGGKTYLRSFPGTKQSADSFLYAVRYLIQKYGSYRKDQQPHDTSKAHNWMTKPLPQNGGKFWYGQYALRIKPVGHLLSKVKGTAVDAHITYLLSGRKRDWGSQDVRETGRKK